MDCWKKVTKYAVLFSFLFGIAVLLICGCHLRNDAKPKARVDNDAKANVKVDFENVANDTLKRPFSNKNLSNWLGEYFYTESCPPNITIVYEINIYKDSRNVYLADIDIEGFQIDQHITTYLLGNDTELDFIYDFQYDSNELYDDGAVLLSFHMEGDVLRTYWKELCCLKQNVYFQKNQNIVDGNWVCEEMFCYASNRVIKPSNDSIISICNGDITYGSVTSGLPILKGSKILYPDFISNKGFENILTSTLVRDCDYDTAYNEYFFELDGKRRYLYPVSETVLLMLDEDGDFYRLVLSND